MDPEVDLKAAVDDEQERAALPLIVNSTFTPILHPDHGRHLRKLSQKSIPVKTTGSRGEMSYLSLPRVERRKNAVVVGVKNMWNVLGAIGKIRPKRINIFTHADIRLHILQW